MNSKTLANAAPQLIFGGFVIILGFLFLLDNMGMIDAGNFFDYWPAVFIMIGLVRIIQAESGAGRLVGSIFALVGFLWILDNIDVFYFSIGRLWPLLLVLIGLAIIWKSLTYEPGAKSACCPTDLMPDLLRKPVVTPPPIPGTREDEVVKGVAVLGAFKRIVGTQDFKAASLTAFMGGCEIDLREAAISDSPAVVDVFAMWGGVELKVPDTWTVELRGVPILGGFEDKTRPPRDRSQVLIVKGMVIFGGVEIRN